MRAQSSQTNMQTVRAEFTPLFPLCLSTLENGSTVSEAQIGYAPAMYFGSDKSYTKARGNGAMARINMERTSFTLGQTGCTFALGNSAALQQGGIVLRELLTENGYQIVSEVKRATQFQKGNRTLQLSGYSVSGTVQLRITPVS